jgi:uncharacterized membrane protein (DUF485 family)
LAQNAVTDTRIEMPFSEADASLEPLLRRRRALAWLLSILTVTITVGFFALMNLASAFMSRVVFGRWITVANVAAVSIILFFLASIALFARQAAEIDARLHNTRRGS